MSDLRQPPDADRLPTLTEVLEFGPGDEVIFGLPDEVARVAVIDEPPAVIAAPPPAFDEAALMQRILDEVVLHVDAMFESRLREALAPALARAADGLIRDTRAELAPALREIVVAAALRAAAAVATPAHDEPEKSPLGV